MQPATKIRNAAKALRRSKRNQSTARKHGRPKGR